MDWGYTREEHQAKTVTGKLRCVIVDVEEGVSKTSGNPMITITVRPSGTQFKVRTWLVKNEKFNQNATRFFDAFPEIGDGNFNFVEWIGAEGAAEFGEDEQGYTNLKWLISGRKAENLPPFEGTKPERQKITALEEEPEDDEDSLPWV